MFNRAEYVQNDNKLSEQLENRDKEFREMSRHNEKLLKQNTLLEDRA